MAVKIYKRSTPKWWMEEAEKLEVTKRLKEEYTGLKAGSDGRNTPSITKQYGKNQVAGAASALGVERLSISERFARMMKEEEELDDLSPGMNDAPEVPVEAEDGFEGEDGDEDLEGDEGLEGDVDVADITITIGGQEFELTPVAVEGDAEGLEGEGGEDLDGDDGAGEGFDYAGGDDISDEDEPEEDEIVESAKKTQLRKKIREAIKKARAKKSLKERRAKRVREADDLYDWTGDLGVDGEYTGDESFGAGDELAVGAAPTLEARKIKAKRIAELKKRLSAKREEIDTLGGKKLAMKTGQRGSKAPEGASAFGLDGGDEFAAPRTQGSSSKAAAIKTSSSTGRYGEKVALLKKKIEAARRRAALAEEESKNDQENFEIENGGYDANYPTELGANPDLIEKYQRIKARRAERAVKVDAPMTEAKKLNFGKLLKEGFGSDSRAEV